MSKVNKKELVKALKGYHIIEMDISIGYEEQMNSDSDESTVKVPSSIIEITLTCVKKKKENRQIIEIDGQSYELRKIKKK